MTTLSNTVRDRRTNVNDKFVVWKSDFDAAIAAMTEEFRPLGGIPAGVKTAKDELVTVFDSCKKSVADVLKVFDDMDFEELTNEQQQGRLDMKTKLTDATSPLGTSNKTLTSVPLFVRKHLVFVAF